MEALWYALISFMLAVYVVLDGFDFGAGIVHLFVARTDEERRTVLGAIGPVWDGNEVWLLAGGGTLVFAFPRAYAAGFSGFYLPLMIVLWLLILRGISIEFRSQVANRLWRDFWDGTFALSSAVLAVVLGAALGNVIRGLPLDATGYFHGPLFTDFRTGPHPGALDWYTVTVGVFALVVLGAHGALYLRWKTEGAVRERAERVALRLWVAVAVMLVLATVGTVVVEPGLYARMFARPWTWPLPIAALVCLGWVFVALRRGRELGAFVGSGGFLASLLAATAAAQFPYILRSTLGEGYSLTAYNAATSRHGLAVGLAWWVPAVLIAIGYFTFLFRSFRGKVKLEEHGHGY